MVLMPKIIVILLPKVICSAAGIVTNPLAVIDPAIKTFLIISAVLGPISIALLILFLKRIEKDDPNRIRWR